MHKIGAKVINISLKRTCCFRSARTALPHILHQAVDCRHRPTAHRDATDSATFHITLSTYAILFYFCQINTNAMNVKDKLKDKSFVKRNLIRLGKFVGFYFAVFIVLAIFLRIYTHHGQTISVPDFKGVMPARASQIAKHENLQLQIIDSTFIDYMPKGCIVDQNPRPGTHVKRNRTIFLTTNAFNRAKVEMPKLVGLSYRQGKATLEMQGMRVGKLIYKPDFAKNNILKQMYNGEPIKEGTMIEKGSTIDLVLGDGHGNNSTPLPNLKGLTLFEATNELNNAYLNIGNVTIENATNAKDSMDAKVYRQEPEYFGQGAKSTLGARIDIWLSAETESAEVEAIDLDD